MLGNILVNIIYIIGSHLLFIYFVSFDKYTYPIEMKNKHRDVVTCV